MSSQIASIWAGATGATIVAVGAAAAYWAHPDFLWPNPSPSVVAKSAPAPGAATTESTAPASAPSAQPAPAAAPAQPAAPSAAAPLEVAKPAFDVVTVAPTGEAVIAGRAAPNAKVELRDAGQTVAEATTDAAGQFVIIPPALAPGGHSLTLAMGAGGSAETSNPIAVAVPAPEAKVAAVAPPKPTAPEPSAPAATPLAISPPAAGSRVAVQSVTADANGGLTVRGASDPNGVVRLYLNGAYVADAKTKSDGKWSLTVESGMTGGAYTVRADEINPADAKVVARAETPFNYPAAPAPSVAVALGAAAAPSVAPAPSVTSAPPAAHAPASANAAAAAPLWADVVVDLLQTARVAPGDTLWGISHTYYGDGTRYRLILAANTSQIRNPNLIYPGQTFVVPKAEAKP